MENKSILSNCTSGGCGAKIGPGELSEVLKNIPVGIANANLLVGFDTSDDAAVYKISDTHSIVSTVDFFSPMVDDAYIFGKIAAANAMSDIWAMGAKPMLALNLVCFPEAMDKAVLGEMLRGGAEKVAEAGASLGGGHSIYDKEPKYGLAVTGMVETLHLLRNNTAKVGDKLILTKPLGTGIVMAATRADLASKKASDNAVDTMQRLNKYAAEKMQNYCVSACTDITGFGLLSHLIEMADNDKTLCVYPAQIPVIISALDYAAEYLLTAAGQRNRNYVGNKADVSALPFALQEIMFDPQTSGGLLIAADPEQSQELLHKIQQDDPQAAIIGEVLPKQQQCIIFA